MEQRVLHFTLRKKWFDMIASGEKKEEYREIKEFWMKRFCDGCTGKEMQAARLCDLQKEYVTSAGNTVFDAIKKTFDAVKFTNGYGKNAPSITVEFKGIEIGTAKAEWSDNWQGEVFKIKLGEIIK